MKFSSWILAAVLLLGFSGIWKLQHAIDVQRAGFYEEQDDLLVRSDKMVKWMSLEYAPFVADLYWTQAVQYYGNKRLRGDANLQLLWPLLDLTTTLDPHLIVAYRFGATFLSDPPPAGAGQPERAIELLQKGIRENPEYWRFYEDMGFVYYFSYKDYAKASAAFLEGSKNPAARPWMKVMAARMAEQGGTLDTSAFLWDELYRSSSDQTIKDNARMHLQLLQAESDCEQLNVLSAEFQKRHGHPPQNIRDFVTEGLLAKVPTDPRGFPYSLTSEGKAQLDPQSPLAQDQRKYQKPL